MMTGRITPGKEVLVRLTVRGNHRERDTEALLDTGFNGYLALPAEWIEALSLDQIGQAELVLASGETTRVRKYEATAVLGERAQPIAQPIEVVEAAEPLLGTELLWGCALRIDFEAGGRVAVEPLP